MSTPSTSEYLLLFRGTDWDKNLSPEEIQETMSQWMAWFERLTQEGKVKAGHPLASEGKLVTGRKGGTIIDGPFAESKEAIGGYFLVQVNDLNEALQIAKECPALEYGLTVEVRPLVESCQIGQRASERRAYASARA
jgi:hypothetical protein